MNLKSKNVQLQYEGYLNTPLLWENDSVFSMQQFQLSPHQPMVFNEILTKHIRLGKLVERFVITELKHDQSIKILKENPQIQNDKITVGEMDCIFKKDGIPIHMEIVYKFYLYDETNTSEIERWIGPNRRDSLLMKLEKLKNKQLPLLYNSASKPLLDSLNLISEEIQQYVFFKAQLFVPWEKENVSFIQLNKACVKGFYIKFTKLRAFTECKFFIPSKKNWLIEVQTQTDWMTYKNFIPKINLMIENKTSPMCWIKFPNGQVEKFFVVWW